jgi:hypothetical protein
LAQQQQQQGQQQQQQGQQQQQQQGQQERRASLEYSEANWLIREAELQQVIRHEQQKAAAAQAQV